MLNRWGEEQAEAAAQDGPVGLRVYSSRLLGEETDLVLHGGGNTSVKGELENVFGETEPVLFVKGSGWDLRTIEAPGFPPVRLEYLRRLGQLDELSDTDMVRHLRLALLDPTGPTPSIEAILHALIPLRYVDHTHADAVVTISNTPGGEKALKEIYGDEVLILPYIMPGFVLAQQVAAATSGLDWSKLRGIVLMHHGIFTFSDDARTSYDNMVELVSRAEEYLARHAPDAQKRAAYHPTQQDCRELSRLRREAGELLGAPCLLRLDHSEEATGFAARKDSGDLARGGPLTPDHTIHAKAFAAVFDKEPASELGAFVQEYQQYFDDNAATGHQRLDTMPRYGLWRGKGMVYLAGNNKRLGIVTDISRHTIKAMQQGDALGGWQALPRKELFEVEYWELEQAKLKSAGRAAEFEGKVVLVSGAASGIGRAAVEQLQQQGACVVALDVAEAVIELDGDRVLAIRCDITEADEIEQALARAIVQFGGIDVLVSNAGNFPPSQALSEISDESWQKSMDLNLSAHMKLLRACLPYLEQGFDPAVVFVASKNVPAPGPGAAAYSAAKAGLTQLARVAALELGASGIRVNTLHPNAVYDTALWTEQVLEERAAHYGMTVAEYRSANVLKTEVFSADVARAIVVLAGITLAKTTGAQLAVDGGNERVI